MEWRKGYLDAILVPLGLMMTAAYHVYLWQKVRTQPLTTFIGTDARGCRLWLSTVMKDSEKKNILTVQTLRNFVMAATQMATTSVLICTGLAALISSTYQVKKPLNDAVYGGHGELMVAVKYATVLTVFLFSFFCHILSIRFMNQVCILTNAGLPPEGFGSCTAEEYVAELLERGLLLNNVGNRLFYVALPLLLWICGPMLVFLCFAIMMPVLYNLDFLLAMKGDRKVARSDVSFVPV